MMLRNHRPGFAIAAMGLAAVLLAAPTTASAGRGDRRAHAEERRRDDGIRQYDHRGRHGGYEYRRDRHRYERRGPARVGPRHERRHHSRWAARGHHGDPFYCGSCRHRFTSRDRFHHHLRSHHGPTLWLPPLLLPPPLLPPPLGWLFFK
jgi:hypothetical protein